MFAKTSLILTLILSLLLVMQAQPPAVPVEIGQGGVCAGMPCAHGCCTNKVCCQVTEQQKVPSKPAPAPQSAPFQFVAIELRAYTILLVPPTAPRSFVTLDEASVAHTLSPLAVSCIRLI